MIGTPSLTVSGQSFELDWGRSHIGVKGKDVDFKIDNGRAARMLGSMPLHQFISTEIARNK